MLALEVKTTEALIAVVEPALTSIINRATKMREKSDIGLRGMARLFAVIQDAHAKLGQLLRLKGRFLNEDQVDRELKTYNNWIDDANNRINIIYKEEVVGEPSIVEPLVKAKAKPSELNTVAGVPVFIAWLVIGCFIFAFITAVSTLLS